jgi:hypothetical protein
MEKLLQPNSPIFLFIEIWSIIWKGIALWKSARFTQKNWFIVLLVLNTAGILEIVYLFRFAKERFKLAELLFWNHSSFHKSK